MLKKHSLRIGIILAAALAVVGILVYTFWPMLAGDRPTLMYFRSPTWPFCKEMNPVVNEIQSNYGRKVNFVYVDVSTPDGKKLVRDYGAMGTPTFVLLDKQGDQVYTIQGVQPRAVLEKALDEILSMPAAQ